MAFRRLATTLCMGVLVTSCMPTPSPSIPTSPAPSTQGPSSAALTSLDACDPAGYVPCDQQAAVLSIPIVDTNLALTYSSQWAAARQERPNWNADALGLGGWSISVVQRYDAADGILIAGDGSWRFAAGVSLAAGGWAVPTFDGSTAYIFDAAGHHIRTVDGHLGTTQLTLSYDPAGRLRTVDGSVSGRPTHLTVKRSDQGAPTAIIGTDGAATTLLLDADGQLVGVRSPGGAAASINWTPGGLVTSETDPVGGVTRFAYDQAGRLTSSTDPDGVVHVAVRTTTGTTFEIRETTTLGRVSTFRTESVDGGIRRTLVGPDGATTTEMTGADGTRAITFPDGSSLTLGAQASSTWGGSAPILTPQVATRPDGIVSRTDIVQALAPAAGFPYALAGSVTSTVNGQAWVQSYDPTARTSTLVDPAGRKQVNAYDADGRLVGSSGPGTPPIAWTYDAQGRESSQTVGSGADSQTTRFSYDPSNGQESITRPDGSVVLVAVDTDGRTTTTAVGGSTLVTGYDADGRLAQVQPPGGLQFALGSSPAGRPTAFLPPAVGTDASAELTAYDGDGRPTSVVGMGSRAIQLAYDTTGRLVGWAFDVGTGSASYDPATHRLASAVDPGGVTTTYGYAGAVVDMLGWSGPLNGSVAVKVDENGRPVSETAGGSAGITRTYDPAGLLAGVAGLALTHDPASGLVTHTSAGTVRTDQQYDTVNQLIRSTTTVSGKVVDDVRYTRDALSRVAMVAETTPTGTTTTAYAYDGADRLASVKVNGATTETDTYDAAGNRTARKTPSGMAAATYDDRDRLVTDGAATLTWADDGQLAKRSDGAGTTTYTFDDFGRLRGITLANGHAITYLVDADGRRIGRKVGGKLVTGYLYDPNGRVVAETDGTGVVVMQFGYDDLGHLAVVERGDASYRVVTDQVGSPRLVIGTTTGAIVDAITYDVWGRITSETAPGTIPFGFAGGLVDPDTGLVHFGARDYDPTAGRWTGPDPIAFTGGDPNLYQYAGSDPVNRVDPSGLAAPVATWNGEYWACAGCPAPPGSTLPGTPGTNRDPLNAQIEATQQADRAEAAAQAARGDTPPASPPATSGQSWSCVGIMCTGPLVGGSGPQRGGCSFGACANGSSGFTCTGVLCVAPNGQECYFCSIGDAHFRTGDGVHVDFQGAGEFIALTSPDGNVEVQARMEGSPQSSVSYNTAVAANVGGDRVGVYSREPASLMVNGVAIKASDIEERLPHGGALQRHGGEVVISWPDGSRLTVTRLGSTLNFGFVPSPAVGRTMRGLLGSEDGNPANDLTTRDGVVLSPSDPDFKTRLYDPFGNSWRITQAESLFDYQAGESTATFTNLDFPSTTATLASLDPAARANAEAVCRALGVVAEPWLDDCILDVGVTGAASFAESEAGIVAAGVPSTVPGSPPTAAGPITIGEVVTGTITSPTEERDYTFAATAGEVVYLEAQASCATDPLAWSLHAPDGSPIDSSGSCNDLGRHVLQVAGIYTVEIYASGTQTGAYAFTVLTVPIVQPATIDLAKAVTGAVDAAGEQRDYTFTTTAGEVVYLEAQASCATDPLLWSLLAPDGSLIDISGSCNDLGRHVLQAAGTYIVRISASGAQTGPYAFTVLAVPIVQPTVVNLGQAVTGTLDAVGEQRDYTFAASAGEAVDLVAQATCATDPLVWSLLRPDGTPIDISGSCNDLGRHVLPVAGIYTIRISASGTQTGQFAFTVRSGQ